MIFPSDERLDVFLCIERLEIVDALAEADVLHRHAELLRNGDADAAFGRAVELCQDNARQTVLQGFQILNNFDIPLGIEFAEGKVPVNIPSATQWTSATDMRHRMIYYRTMYNSAIRSIDLNKIDFQRVKYRAVPLDTIKEQPVMEVSIR